MRHKEDGCRNNPDVTVVIPAFNEQMRLPKTLKYIGEYFAEQGYLYEIIVVDDGSSDKTGLVVRQMSNELNNIVLLSNDMNMGKGYSVKRGMMKAKGHFVIFSDADLSTPIEEANELMRWVGNGYDIAIASRGLKESDIRIHQPFYREYMGKTFNVLVRLFMMRGIKDTQCGFKCFKREVVKDIFPKQKLRHFSFDVEILHIARKQGFSIKEVPVAWFNESNSRVNAFTDSAQMLFDLLKIKYFEIRGEYE
jgi:dolichyl-phosphate beta-glucosyltransferase